MDYILPTIFFAALVLQSVVRLPNARKKGFRKFQNDMPISERTLLSLTGFGMFFSPLIYLFTPWISGFDYNIPFELGIIGLPLAAFAVWLFWRSHVDLGKNWAPVVVIRKEHTLITGGVFSRIRHPMYASQFVLCVAEILLIHNWLAGPLNLVAFTILYLIRVPREEKALEQHFGKEYADYEKKTGRIFPRL